VAIEAATGEAHLPHGCLLEEAGLRVAENAEAERFGIRYDGADGKDVLLDGFRRCAERVGLIVAQDIEPAYELLERRIGGYGVPRW
jgi:hypothetical protein